MAANRLRTIVGHLKGGNMATAIKVLEDPALFQTYGNPEPSFRFTVDSADSLLTTEERHFYEENGYIVIRNLVDHQDIDKYAKRFEDIAHRRVKVPGLVVMKDVAVKDKESSQFVVNKLQDLFLDDELFAYCRTPKILDFVSSFIGPNIMAVHTMLINKPPDSGSMTSRHPLHQDLHYFPFRPADRIVCSWTAMERVTRENGCLVAIPGSHRGALLEHDYPDWEGGVNKGYHGIKGASDVLDRRVFLEMEKGDTVFFHPILIHGSGANRSQGFRKAISCHYAASECEYIDVTGTSQENIAQEVIEIAQRRGIPITDFRDAWRFRAQIVRGDKVNL
ncbi:phytanoyl-CoA dioxygenase, peroxisomal [Galendromus occidentalis]|uniref:phytanoyl-CoA dioxygenase n=1 Tax=Galendromus occidentalis TaxID=34638 RepID=A0AAJ6VZS5_9ACAR|nr:phytanoyl-CoA dioxygenase, peroxisomal [Galendromus occidentalis]